MIREIVKQAWKYKGWVIIYIFLLTLSLWGLFGVNLPSKAPPPQELRDTALLGTHPGFNRHLTGEERHKLYLYALILENGGDWKTFNLLREIARCESAWRQFTLNSSPLISKGNMGIFQINKLAHAKTYTAMNLDVLNNPYENIEFGYWLYQRDYIRPWKNWSGHCWYAKVKKVGLPQKETR